MDRFDAMRVFTRIVERRSFTMAAQDLNLPRSTVTDAIREMEERLGVRLLQRTTRVVSPTLDGEAYYQRCLTLIAEMEEAEASFSGSKPKGILRVDMLGRMAEEFLMPGLPAFMAEYPDIELFIGESARYVDLVREGVDCVIRAGELRDSDMIVRRLGLLPEITCASPAYLERHGLPHTPDELAGHRMAGFVGASGHVFPLEFVMDGEVRNVTLPMSLSVNGSEIFIAAVRQGLGLGQFPRYLVRRQLDSGELVEVLRDFAPTPTPVSLLYPRNRQLSSRVRVFADWAVRRFAASEGMIRP